MAMTVLETLSGAQRSTNETTLPIPPLVRHKVTPPQTDPQTILRPRLHRALDAAATHRLTVVAAPAGYGKTTLLGGWAAAQVVRASAHPGGPRLAWLTLSPEENNPIIFAALLVAALHEAGLGSGWLHPPAGDTTRSAKLTLAWALNAVAADDVPVVLVLDGYEALINPEAYALVGLLLEQGPPGLRLVVAGRGEPALPLARLRARRQLAELRAADLRWNVAEAAAYLNERLTLALEPARVAELVELTEGWIAGLSLAALALEAAHSARAPLASPSAAPSAYEASGPEIRRFLDEYLVSEVLEREPDVVQRFLLQTALLDELSGPLVEGLLLPEEGAAERVELLGGLPSGQAALEAFERRGLFLFQVEGRPGAYRYHRLFAAALRAQLERRLPERAAELARRGAVGPERADAPTRAEAREAGGLAEPLSEREREILVLVAAGKPNREVAERLVISESTVKSHIKHIFAKLGARNRTEAVAIARDLQIITV